MRRNIADHTDGITNSVSRCTVGLPKVVGMSAVDVDGGLHGHISLIWVANAAMHKVTRRR
jgi:hypothetical protein